MTNSEILATLQKHEIRTVGDLDHYADVRSISRWHALAQLVGESAADHILARLEARKLESEGHMTELLKTIRRVTRGRRRDRSKSRALVISLEPGDIVGIRMQGTRQTYRRGIEAVYEDAIRYHLARIDKRARQLVKSEGLKMRSAMVKARKELAQDLKP